MKFLICDDERELDLVTNANIRLAQDGLEMPLVARELTYAESADSDGRRRVRTKNQNAEGRVGVNISGTSDSHFWGNVDNLVELVDSCHRNRGSIVYQPPGGTAVIWDVESMTVSGLPQPGVELRRRRQQAEVTFEVQPYGRLAPIELISGGTLDGPIDYVTVENVPGQVMAFGDLELTEISSQTRNFVEVGVQADFDPTNPEPVFLTAGSMADAGGTLTAISGAAGTALRPAGAYTTSGGNSYTVKTRLSATPTSLVTTSSRPHKGLWKLRARVQGDADGILVRLAWRVGNGPWTREGWRTAATASAWLDLDLGTIDIPTLTGTHSFEARLEAVAQTGYPNIDVDSISLIPADRYLKVRGVTISETTSALLAADDFNSHAAGTLTAKTPPVTAGGNWTGSGDTDDFNVIAGGVVQRSAVSDSANTGRWMRAGTAVATGVDVRCDISRPQQAYRAGVFARYGDTNNFLMARVESSLVSFGGPSSWVYALILIKRVSGTFTTLATLPFFFDDRIALVALSDGRVYVNGGPANAAALTNRLFYAGDSDLQSGGALDDGTYGIYHENNAATAALATFDNFTVTTASAPTLNPSIFSGRELEIDQKSANVASSDGSFYAPAPIREGNYLLLPPATRSEQKSRIVVRARRDDIDGGFADAGLTDDLTAKLSVTPRVTLK
jgi:hypothetical protein